MVDRPTLYTAVGRHERGEHLFRGRRVFAELAGRKQFWELASLSLGGPELSDEDLVVLDDLTSCALAADPRIPALKVSRLIGAYGSQMISFAALFMPLEDGLFGPWSCLPVARILVELGGALGEAPTEQDVEALVKARLDRGDRMHGFGVPAREVDERVEKFSQLLEMRGRAGRRYWKLLRQLEAVMVRNKKGSINLSAAVAAGLLDLGFDAEQTPMVSVAIAVPVAFATAQESAVQAPAALRHLPDELIEYVGAPPRLSPRARQARGG